MKEIDIKTMTVWIAAFILMGVVLCSPVACTMNQQALISDAINKGSDPIAVKCALEGGMASQPMCIAKAMQSPQQK